MKFFLGDLWKTWTLEPEVVILLVLSGVLYWRGYLRDRILDFRFEAACFAAGWLALVIALCSPLHYWGRVLFSVHMLQHLILILVAAPLLVLGRPFAPFLLAFSPECARALSGWTRSRAWRVFWRFLTLPLVAWLLHAIALWTWHIPALFQKTIDSELVHSLQHLSFLFSALLFWWAVIHGRKGLAVYRTAALYLFTTAAYNGLLGALLLFAGTNWYPAYANATQSWGLTPIQDQKLGGLILLLPGCVLYIVALLPIFSGCTRESERRILLREKMLERQ